MNPHVHDLPDPQGLSAQREAALRYRLTTQTSREIHFFAGPDGQIREASARAEQSYGYSQEEFRRMRLEDLYGPDDGSGQIYHRRRDGSLFPVEVSTSSAGRGRSRLILTTVHPACRRQLLASMDLLQQEIDQILDRCEPLERLLKHICQRMCELFGFATAWLGVPRPDGRISVKTQGGEHLWALDSIPSQEKEILPCHELAALALSTGNVQTLELIHRAGRLHSWAQALHRTRMTRAIAIPLGRANPFAVLTLFSRQVHRPDPEWVDLLSRYASQSATTVMHRLNREESLLQQAALNAAANAVALTDNEGQILWTNPAWERLTGYSAAEANGSTPRMLKSGLHDDSLYADLWQTISAGRVWFGTMWNRRKDGSLYLDEQTVTPIRRGDGSITHFIAIKQDVTERKRQEERLQYLATHDPLTDLPNRRMLEGWLWQMVAQAESGGGAVILLNIDRFKRLNSALGQVEGDQILISLARILRACDAVPGQQVCRMGGDEFAILLPQVDQDGALALCEWISRRVDEFRYASLGATYSLCLSMGVTMVDGTASPIQAVAQASEALSAAKERGGNRAVLYQSLVTRRHSPGMTSSWATRIKDALREGRMQIHFQPIVHMVDQTVLSQEVLLRMVDEVGVLLLPAHFLPAAEEFGLMPQVDRWVVRKALEHLQAEPSLRLFINLSAHSLMDESFLLGIEADIRTGNIDPARITFEITETAAVGDLVSAQLSINRLNQLGCSFALDDFGTGFSSFRYLRELPAQYIKIDGIFVRNLESDPVNRSLVRALALAARETGKTVIAEWVESAETARLLREMGVEFGQGFYWGRPVARKTELHQ